MELFQKDLLSQNHFFCKEVSVFNNIQSELNKLKGHRIKHFILMGKSDSHTLESIEEHAFLKLEHLGREKTLLGSHFVNISPDMPYERALVSYSFMIIQLEGKNPFMLDAVPSDMIPVTIISEGIIIDTTEPTVSGPNIDADKLLSPAIGKEITDIIINSFTEEEFDMTLCMEENVCLRVCSDQSWLSMECCDGKGITYELPFSELREYLWLSYEDKEAAANQSYYVDIGYFSEDMCSVAAVSYNCNDLAYHSDHSDKAGIWGFINKYGEEVIKPQYIYTFEFEDGIAIVAKGKWGKEREDENGNPLYWSQDERWGGIDYTGNEVIPFIFDEIEPCFDTTDYFIAHVGGWPDGSWGVIDRTGKWVTEPKFERLDNDWNDGLLVFEYYNAEICDSLYGLYGAVSNKVILDPVNSDIWFNDDGTVEIESYDKDYSKRIKKVVNIDDLKTKNV